MLVAWVQLMEFLGFIDRFEHRMGRTALDVVVKIIYS